MPTSVNPFTQPWDGQPHLSSWGCHNQYEEVTGVFELPVAENAPTDPIELQNWSPVTVVVAHAPYRRRKVLWVAEKKGNPPVIPSPESTGAFTFLSGTVEFGSPRMDQSFLKYDWHVEGSYTFVETVRSDPGDGFVLSAPPFATTTQNANSLLLQPTGGQFGAIAVAGVDAQIGRAQEVVQSVSSPVFLYNTVSYFPGSLCNASILNGDGHPLSLVQTLAPPQYEN